MCKTAAGFMQSVSAGVSAVKNKKTIYKRPIVIYVQIRNHTSSSMQKRTKTFFKKWCLWPSSKCINN